MCGHLVVLQHAPHRAHDAGGVGAPHRGRGRSHAQPALLSRGVNKVSRCFHSAQRRTKPILPPISYGLCGQAFDKKEKAPSLGFDEPHNIMSAAVWFLQWVMSGWLLIEVLSFMRALFRLISHRGHVEMRNDYFQWFPFIPIITNCLAFHNMYFWQCVPSHHLIS